MPLLSYRRRRKIFELTAHLVLYRYFFMEVRMVIQVLAALLQALISLLF